MESLRDSIQPTALDSKILEKDEDQDEDQVQIGENSYPSPLLHEASGSIEKIAASQALEQGLMVDIPFDNQVRKLDLSGKEFPDTGKNIEHSKLKLPNLTPIGSSNLNF
jgi:hypothetical protein